MHQTVLLEQAVEGLAIKADGFYLDATYGRGGHSRGILSRLGKQGYLLALDRDPEAIASVPEALVNDPRFFCQQMPFSRLQEAIKAVQLPVQVQGILFDLGVSSPQFDQAQRGFSFQKDGPLDMRMDTTAAVTAKDWINSAKVQEMVEIFRNYGEEKFAFRIANAIEQRRKEKPFETTLDLAEVIKKANPAWEKHKHPATRVFQAIRIHINQELAELKQALEQALSVLAPGGRLVVISFHSLEDRYVKRFMREKAQGQHHALRGLPIKVIEENISLKIVGKAIFPTEEEITRNPRARSAVLRIAEKI